MYYVIEDSQLKEWGDFKFSEDCKELKNITMNEFNKVVNKYVIKGDILTANPTYYETQQAEEQERTSQLTMTALDFINVLKQFGLTTIQIKEYLDKNIELDQQLKYCQKVYCGVVQQLCPLRLYGIVISKEDIIEAFKQKSS